MAALLSLQAFVALQIITVTWGAKVLLQPANYNSHMVYFGQLAAALSQEGHVTSLLVPSNAKLPKSLPRDVEVITFEVPDAIPFSNIPECSELFVKAAFAESFSETMEVLSKIDMQTYYMEECHHLFTNDQLIKKLLAANFDVVVVDTAMPRCAFTMPYKLGVPHVSFGISWAMWLMRVPALPSFVPTVISDYSDRMSFQQRLGNTFFEALNYMYMNTSDDYSIRTYVPEKPPVTIFDMMRKSALFFVLADDVVSYPSPTMPNVINLGDIMVRPAEQLPDDLTKYMDASKNGVILVSFGSFIDHLPPEIICRISSSLSRLPQDVLWRMKHNDLQCQVSGNVKLMSWVPQNDLLAHPNMKLFVSHCGFSSLIEAVYHAVPLLALPLSVDQPFNAEVVRSHGYGLRLEFKNFTEDELVDTITHVLSENSFKERITKASRILRHKPLTAAQRASFWIDHIVKYGDDHLRTKAFELTDAQFFMLDIYAFVTGVLLFLGTVMLCCCRLLYALCRRMFGRNQTVKAKTE